jgi:hypothetical protein
MELHTLDKHLHGLENYNLCKKKLDALENVKNLSTLTTS